MTKIKIFASDSAYEVERMVNDFIKDKKVVDIKYSNVLYHTNYGSYVPLNNCINDRVLIIYEE